MIKVILFGTVALANCLGTCFINSGQVILHLIISLFLYWLLKSRRLYGQTTIDKSNVFHVIQRKILVMRFVFSIMHWGRILSTIESQTSDSIGMIPSNQLLNTLYELSKHDSVIGLCIAITMTSFFKIEFSEPNVRFFKQRYVLELSIGIISHINACCECDWNKRYGHFEHK